MTLFIWAAISSGMVDGRQENEITRRVAIANNNMRKCKKLITYKTFSITITETWNSNNHTIRDWRPLR